MNTPERNQIGSSLSKFEDSPVFNYLSNLSPIKPVRTAPITQTFTSLNFSTLPSVFTSPHVRGSRILRRHITPCKSQVEFSYMDISGNKENEVFVDVNQLHNYPSEAPLEPLNRESDSLKKNPQSIKYDPGSSESEHNEACRSASEDASHSTEAATLSAMFDEGPLVQGTATQKVPSDWESLTSDGADLLMFDSPNMAKDLKALFKSPPIVRMGSSLASKISQDTPDFQNFDSSFLVDLGELQNEVHYAETQGTDCGHNDYHTMAECLTGLPNEDVDDEPTTSLYRGVRRRCLVFDTNAAHMKNVYGASSSNSSIRMQSDQNVSLNNREMVMGKTAYSSSMRILSGFGLHLNALATSGESGVHAGLSSSVTSFQSPATAQESLHDIITGASSEKNADSGVVQGSEDEGLSQGLASVDDFNQNSPRKKRRKPEAEGSGDESCKRCNCKKSKCLKLYCECFAAGVYCIGTCACQDCFNKPIHEDTVLATRKQIESRNPLAFAPKVIKTSDPLPDVKDEFMNTPASARHKRGCNCKKSSCQKKYCECYQGGVGCSVSCRCETCKNVFGTKDGSIPVSSNDYDEEEEETVKVEKKMKNRGSRNTMSRNIEEHNSNIFPATPRTLTRSSVQVASSSKGKPPRSSFLTRQNLVMPNHLNPPPKFQRNYPAGQDETGIPQMLRINGSPNSVVKTSSPNSKRVSSPHSNSGSSTGRRSTRKLILQSIPSFPSLTQP